MRSGKILIVALLLTGLSIVVAATTYMTVTPVSGSFGNQPVGTSSSPIVFSFKNTGTFPIDITALSIAGVDPKDYTITAQTCKVGNRVGVRVTCTVTVVFKPTVAGARSAALNISGQYGL